MDISVLWGMRCFQWFKDTKMNTNHSSLVHDARLSSAVSVIFYSHVFSFFILNFPATNLSVFALCLVSVVFRVDYLLNKNRQS